MKRDWLTQVKDGGPKSCFGRNANRRNPMKRTTNLWLGILAAFGLAGPVSAQQGMMSGYGMGIGWVWMILIVVLVVLAILALAKYLRK